MADLSMWTLTHKVVDPTGRPLRGEAVFKMTKSVGDSTSNTTVIWAGKVGIRAGQLSVQLPAADNPGMSGATIYLELTAGGTALPRVSFAPQAAGSTVALIPTLLASWPVDPVSLPVGVDLGTYALKTEVLSGSSIGLPTATTTAGVQAALNSAATFGVGVVTIPPGAYTLGPLTIYGATTLRGPGAKITYAAGSTQPLISSPDDGVQRYRARIEDLEIDGNAANQTGAVPVVHLRGMNEARITNVTITNTRGPAIKTGQGTAGMYCTTPIISGCVIRGHQSLAQGEGIVLDSGSSDAEVSRCDIGFYPNGAGVLLSGHSGATLTSVKAWQCKYGYQQYQAPRAIFSACLADYSKLAGFVSQQSATTRFVGCTARESSMATANTSDGFWIEGTAGTPVVDVQLTGCISYGSQARYGLNLAYADRARLAGNTWAGNQTGEQLLGAGVTNLVDLDRPRHSPRPPITVQGTPDKVVTNLSPATGYSASGAASSNLADTTDFARGTSSCLLTSAGTGAQTNLDNLNISPLNYAGRYFRVWLKVPTDTDLTNIAKLNVFLGDGASSLTNYRRLQLWDGATVQGSDSRILRAGTWRPFTFSAADAKTTQGTPSSIAATDLRFQLVDRAGGLAASVRWNGLETIPSPAVGRVSVTFDDGEASVLLGKAAMEAAGIVSTQYIIPDLIGQSGRMTMADLYALRDADHEISMHWWLASHAAHLTNVSTALLEAEGATAAAWLRSNAFGDGLAYPGGSHNQSVIDVLRNAGFTYGRTIDGETVETLPPMDPWRLRAFSSISSASGGRAASAITALIDQAAQYGLWVILVFHKLTTGAPSATTECTVTDFTTIMNYLATKRAAGGIRTETVAQVLRGDAAQGRHPGRGSVTLKRPGTLTVAVGGDRVYNPGPDQRIIESVQASIGTASAGATVIADVNVDGVSIYSDQNQRAAIAAGSNYGGVGTMHSTWLWPVGSYVTMDVDQIGSTTAGSDLSVQINYR